MAAGEWAVGKGFYCTDRFCLPEKPYFSDGWDVWFHVTDGISCRRPGKNTYPIIEKNVDDIVTVEENDILEATKLVAKETKLLAEPTSCVGIAAALSKKIQLRPDEKTAFVLTSGNWDIDLLGKIYNDIKVEGVH